MHQFSSNRRGRQKVLPFLSSVFSPPVAYDRAPHNSTPTSQAAARHVAPKMPTRRARILSYIRQCGYAGATADEICQALEMWPQSATPRINELAKAGHITDSGRTRLTRSSRNAIVWIATN